MLPQNPFRRPVATTVFLIGTGVALWLVGYWGNITY